MASLSPVRCMWCGVQIGVALQLTAGLFCDDECFTQFARPKARKQAPKIPLRRP